MKNGKTIFSLQPSVSHYGTNFLQEFDIFSQSTLSWNYIRSRLIVLLQRNRKTWIFFPFDSNALTSWKRESRCLELQRERHQSKRRDNLLICLHTSSLVTLLLVLHRPLLRINNRASCHEIHIGGDGSPGMHEENEQTSRVSIQAYFSIVSRLSSTPRVIGINKKDCLRKWLLALLSLLWLIFLLEERLTRERKRGSNQLRDTDKEASMKMQRPNTASCERAMTHIQQDSFKAILLELMLEKSFA
jgi:hypothetical protein